MSLRVWLPLTGTLENKGVSNIIATNSGATVNTSGKIGSCYAFNGSSKITATGVSIPAGPISASAWVYFDTNITDLLYVVSLNGGSGFADHEVGLAIQSSSYYFVVGGNSSCAIGTPVLNTWTHMAVTFDGTTIRGYINGTLVKSVSSTATLTKTTFTVGARNNGSTNYAYFLKGRANDVRIYDHCLSAAEVKEISLGLVLHYKLDSLPYNFSTNTITSFTNFTIGLYYYTIFSINMTDFLSRTGAVNGDKFTFSVDINATSNTKRLAARVLHFNSSSDRNSVIGNYIEPGLYGRSSITFTVNTAYTRLDFMINNGNSSNVTANSTELYKCTRIEKGDVHSGYLSNEITPYIQDSSGYGHNGTIEGNILIVPTEGRYTASIKLNSENPTTNTTGAAYIVAPLALNSPSLMTIAWWAKPENGYGSSAGHAAFATTNNSMPSDYNTTAFNHRDSGFDINYSTTGSNAIRLSLAYTLNELHHYAVTYDGLTAIAYKDGIQTATKSFSAKQNLMSFVRLFIGYSQAGGVKRKTVGTYSDFRVYCTALSADDILSLYHTAAKVDNLGGLHTFELNENLPNIFFKLDSARGICSFQDGLSRYTQSNCQVTLTNLGYRIYRPPNYNPTDNGNTMWGGLKLVNQSTDTVSPYNATRDNIWGLQQGHIYLWAFHAKGKSSNATSLGFTNNMGWGVGGVSPGPTIIVNDGIPANFLGEKECLCIFNIGDNIIKISNDNRGGYDGSSQYLSYRHLTMGWGYTNTGELGTDIYLTNFRLYDITNFIGQIKKNGLANFSDFVENNSIARILKNAEFLTNNLIER